MAYPKNPETIVLRNSYYRNGLKEKEVYEYYQKMKYDILKETKSRDVMLGIATAINKIILRRKGKGKNYIRLTPQNYDEIITGRTISIYSIMGTYEDVGIIDIDVLDNNAFKLARQATNDVYDFVMDKMPIVRTAQIRFTGKTSFHIACYFNQKIKIDGVRFLLERFLQNSDLARIYTISGKRKAGIVNIDLSPNKYKGAFITLGSLSQIGLKCQEVSYNKLMGFNPNQARI